MYNMSVTAPCSGKSQEEEYINACQSTSAALSRESNRITSFGAFVELENGKTGLVHISEVADTYVRDINDFLKEQDRVKVKVINITDGKIGLSIKQANPNYSEEPIEADQTENRIERKF